MKGNVTINVMPSFYCHQNEGCLSFRHFELNPFCTRIHKLDNTKRITKATLFPRALITNDRLVAQELQFPHVVKCQQRLSSREQVLCSPSAVLTPGHPGRGEGGLEYHQIWVNAKSFEHWMWFIDFRGFIFCAEPQDPHMVSQHPSIPSLLQGLIKLKVYFMH